MNDILKTDIQYTYDNLTGQEKARFEGSNILITGCAGFLGYYFLHFFYRFIDELKINRVIGLDNFMLGQPDWIQEIQKDSRLNINPFNIIKDDISSIAGAEKADLIIHLASIASPTFYRQYPIETLDANIWGLRNLLEYYKEKKIRGFLFFSSSEIYGDPVESAIPTNEEYRGNVSATGPRSCYDESKRFGETMCMLFAQKFNIPIGVARPFNNYGPGMKLNDKRVPADFAKMVLEDKDIVILSDGRPTRTFCYIADAIAGYLKILVYGQYDYFNIGIESPEISIYELAEIYIKAAREIFNYKGDIKYFKSEDVQYLAHNPQRRCPNIKKAQTILGYDPKIQVNEGVKRFLQYVYSSTKEQLIW
jgi:UDP-glucuronate decarboxylase